MKPLRLSLTLLPMFLIFAVVQFFHNDEPANIAFAARWNAQRTAERQNAAQQGITVWELGKKVTEECVFNNYNKYKEDFELADCFRRIRYCSFYEDAYNNELWFGWLQFPLRLTIAAVSAFIFGFGSVYTAKMLRSVWWPWVSGVWWPWIRGK
jgi:hypothetical protein